MGWPRHWCVGQQPIAHEDCCCFPAKDLLTTIASALLVFVFPLGHPDLQREQSSQASRDKSALGTPPWPEW